MTGCLMTAPGAVLQRRMIDHGKFDEGVFLPPGPIAEKFLGHLMNVGCLYVAGDHQRGIIRYVIATLDRDASSRWSRLRLSAGCRAVVSGWETYSRDGRSFLCWR